MTVGLLLVDWARRESPGYYDPSRFDMAGAEELTVEDLTTLYPQVLLPTWMPEGIELTKIYADGGFVMVAYSHRDETDYRKDNVTIELMGVPQESTMQRLLEKYPDQRFAFGNMTGVVKMYQVQYGDESPVHNGAAALFIHDYIQYTVSGVSGHHSESEVRRIIESMRPVGSTTMRKVPSSLGG